MAGAQITAPAVECNFDLASLQFAGTPVEQARCLLRHVDPDGGAAPQQELPQRIAELVGQPVQIDQCKLTASLRAAKIPLPATMPVSETSDHVRAI